MLLLVLFTLLSAVPVAWAQTACNVAADGSLSLAAGSSCAFGTATTSTTVRLTSLIVPSSASLLIFGAVTLDVSGSATVAGSINADGRGFGSLSGPGAPPSSVCAAGGAGAGHGGFGTMPASASSPSGGLAGQIAFFSSPSNGGVLSPTAAANAFSYGSVYWPTQPGSGGCGAAGGGAIILKVGGTLTLSGSITARGQSALTGPGSGGSVALQATTLNIASISPTATISVAGAAGTSSASAGGRISIRCASHDLADQSADVEGFVSAFASLTAAGGNVVLSGSTVNAAGAGTVFVSCGSVVDSLVVDNAVSSALLAAPTTALQPRFTVVLDPAVLSYNFRRLRVSNGAILHFARNNNASLAVAVSKMSGDGYRSGGIWVGNNTMLILNANATSNNAATPIAGSGELSYPAVSVSSADTNDISLTVTYKRTFLISDSTAFCDAGLSLTVDPTSMLSGPSRLAVTGGATLNLGGKVSGIRFLSIGSGSTVNLLPTGSSVVESANAPTGTFNFSTGGISLTSTSGLNPARFNLESSVTLLAGFISGSGNSIVTAASVAAGGTGVRVSVGQGGLSASLQPHQSTAMTPWSFGTDSTLDVSGVCSIEGIDGNFPAKMEFGSGNKWSCGSLTTKGNVYLETLQGFAGLTVTGSDISKQGGLTFSNLTTVVVNRFASIDVLKGDFLLPANAKIDGVGRGYAAGLGPGAPPSTRPGFGAAHGGCGSATDTTGCGRSSTSSLALYDDLEAPAAAGTSSSGSGGAAGASGGAGGAGGAAFKLSVSGSGSIFIHGVVDCSAGATPASSFTTAGGGGSGGSVQIEAGNIGPSTGVVRANGGAGGTTASGGAANAGYGGGGGRVSLVAKTHSFSGSVKTGDWSGFTLTTEALGGISVRSSGSAYSGQPGSVFISIASTAPRMLRFDNNDPNRNANPIAMIDSASFARPLNETQLSGIKLSLEATSPSLGLLTVVDCQITIPDASAPVSIRTLGLDLLRSTLTLLNSDTTFNMAGPLVIRSVPTISFKGNLNFLLSGPTGDVKIAAGVVFDGNGKANVASSASTSSGGNHAGCVRTSSSCSVSGAYGSFWAPVAVGQNGGDFVNTGYYSATFNGGKGGAALRIAASGSMAFDGSISVNGLAGAAARQFNYGDSGAGGGAGGSVWLSAGTITSFKGTITAHGGAGGRNDATRVSSVGGSGGAGGRIAVICRDDSEAADWQTSVTADGGSGYAGAAVAASGPGTVYLDCGTRYRRTLRLVNPSSRPDAGTAVATSATHLLFDRVHVDGMSDTAITWHQPSTNGDGRTIAIGRTTGPSRTSISAVSMRRYVLGFSACSAVQAALANGAGLQFSVNAVGSGDSTQTGAGAGLAGNQLGLSNAVNAFDQSLTLLCALPIAGLGTPAENVFSWAGVSAVAVDSTSTLVLQPNTVLTTTVNVAGILAGLSTLRIDSSAGRLTLLNSGRTDGRSTVGAYALFSVELTNSGTLELGNGVGIFVSSGGLSSSSAGKFILGSDVRIDTTGSFLLNGGSSMSVGAGDASRAVIVTAGNASIVGISSVTFKGYLNITTASSFALGSGSTINGNGGGFLNTVSFDPSTGGTATTGSRTGGIHAGCIPVSASTCSLSSGKGAYGSLFGPIEKGSGGGDFVNTGYYSATFNGGKGGAALRIAAAGSMAFDGAASVNGLAGAAARQFNYGDSGAGGGAGGSAWLSAFTVTSFKGGVTANGGAGGASDSTSVSSEGGMPGSGGRISVTCRDDLEAADWQAGLFASGGNGFSTGRTQAFAGAGTIYLDCGSRYRRTLRIAAPSPSTVTAVTGSPMHLLFDSVILSGVGANSIQWFFPDSAGAGMTISIGKITPTAAGDRIALQTTTTSQTFILGYFSCPLTPSVSLLPFLDSQLSPAISGGGFNPASDLSGTSASQSTSPENRFLCSYNTSLFSFAGLASVTIDGSSTLYLQPIADIKDSNVVLRTGFLGGVKQLTISGSSDVTLKVAAASTGRPTGSYSWNKLNLASTILRLDPGVSIDAVDATIGGSASVTTGGTITWSGSTLTAATGSTLTLNNGATSFTLDKALSLAGAVNWFGTLQLKSLADMTIATGAVLVGKAGSSSSSGPTSNGGSHAGCVRTSSSCYVSGAYGSFWAPVAVGQNGGDFVNTGYYSATFNGGNGGGVLRAIVDGGLSFTGGSISVNGLAGADARQFNYGDSGAGGGAGGSVWLSAGTITSFKGTITAHGGAGGRNDATRVSSVGGSGGAGGRIAVICRDDSEAADWQTSVTADGGSGYAGAAVAASGPGTVYLDCGTRYRRTLRLVNPSSRPDAGTAVATSATHLLFDRVHVDGMSDTAITWHQPSTNGDGRTIAIGTLTGASTNRFTADGGRRVVLGYTSCDIDNPSFAATFAGVAVNATSASGASSATAGAGLVSDSMPWLGQAPFVASSTSTSTTLQPTFPHLCSPSPPTLSPFPFDRITTATVVLGSTLVLTPSVLVTSRLEAYGLLAGVRDFRASGSSAAVILGNTGRTLGEGSQGSFAFNSWTANSGNTFLNLATGTKLTVNTFSQDGGSLQLDGGNLLTANGKSGTGIDAFAATSGFSFDVNKLANPGCAAESTISVPQGGTTRFVGASSSALGNVKWQGTLKILAAGNLTTANAFFNGAGGGCGPGISGSTPTSSSAAGYPAAGGHAACFGSTSCGSVYGDGFRPTFVGSGGASFVNTGYYSATFDGGKGGAALRIAAAGSMAFDGTASVNGLAGAAARQFNYGDSGACGGAGGSVWLSAGTIASFKGTITAHGGAGGARDSTSVSSEGGYGGSAGRIAVYARETSDGLDDWSARLTAYGGTSRRRTTATDGGAGTIFVDAGNQYRRVMRIARVSASNLAYEPTVITTSSFSTYAIGTLHTPNNEGYRHWTTFPTGLSNFALSFVIGSSAPAGTVPAGTVWAMGLRYAPGTVDVDITQPASFEPSYKPPFAGIDVQPSGTLLVPDGVIFDSPTASPVTFNVNGRVGGGSTVNVLNGAILAIGASANAAFNSISLTGGTLTTAPNKVSAFANFSATGGSVLNLGAGSVFNVAGDFNIGTGVTINAPSFSLVVNGSMKLGVGSVLKADGGGDAAGQGTAPGQGVYGTTSAGSIAGGGAHAGLSGGCPAVLAMDSRAVVTGAKLAAHCGVQGSAAIAPYGSFIAPASKGSGGANGAASGVASSSAVGGSGGGTLRIEVAGQALIEGRISADGTNGVTSPDTAVGSIAGGGGSGGSIDLRVGTLVAPVSGVPGTISANGGNGGVVKTGNGGSAFAGSGGRVSLRCTSDATTSSTFVNLQSYGGLSSSNTAANADYAPAGTVFVDCGPTRNRLLQVRNNPALKAATFNTYAIAAGSAELAFGTLSFGRLATPLFFGPPTIPLSVTLRELRATELVSVPPGSTLSMLPVAPVPADSTALVPVETAATFFSSSTVLSVSRRFTYNLVLDTLSFSFQADTKMMVPRDATLIAGPLLTILRSNVTVLGYLSNTVSITVADAANVTISPQSCPGGVLALDSVTVFPGSVLTLGSCILVSRNLTIFSGGILNYGLPKLIVTSWTQIPAGGTIVASSPTGRFEAALAFRRIDSLVTAFTGSPVTITPANSSLAHFISMQPNSGPTLVLSLEMRTDAGITWTTSNVTEVGLAVVTALDAPGETVAGTQRPCSSSSVAYDLQSSTYVITCSVASDLPLRPGAITSAYVSFSTGETRVAPAAYQVPRDYRLSLTWDLTNNRGSPFAVPSGNGAIFALEPAPRLLITEKSGFPLSATNTTCSLAIAIDKLPASASASASDVIVKAVGLFMGQAITVNQTADWLAFASFSSFGIQAPANSTVRLEASCVLSYSGNLLTFSAASSITVLMMPLVLDWQTLPPPYALPAELPDSSASGAVPTAQQLSPATPISVLWNPLMFNRVTARFQTATVPQSILAAIGAGELVISCSLAASDLGDYDKTGSSSGSTSGATTGADLTRSAPVLLGGASATVASSSSGSSLVASWPGLGLSAPLGMAVGLVPTCRWFSGEPVQLASTSGAVRISRVALQAPGSLSVTVSSTSEVLTAPTEMQIYGPAPANFALVSFPGLDLTAVAARISSSRSDLTCSMTAQAAPTTARGSTGAFAFVPVNTPAISLLSGVSSAGQAVFALLLNSFPMTVPATAISSFVNTSAAGSATTAPLSGDDGSSASILAPAVIRLTISCAFRKRELAPLAISLTTPSIGLFFSTPPPAVIVPSSRVDNLPMSPVLVELRTLPDNKPLVGVPNDFFLCSMSAIEAVSSDGVVAPKSQLYLNSIWTDSTTNSTAPGTGLALFCGLYLSSPYGVRVRFRSTCTVEGKGATRDFHSSTVAMVALWQQALPPSTAAALSSATSSELDAASKVSPSITVSYNSGSQSPIVIVAGRPLDSTSSGLKALTLVPFSFFAPKPMPSTTCTLTLDSASAAAASAGGGERPQMVGTGIRADGDPATGVVPVSPGVKGPTGVPLLVRAACSVGDYQVSPPPLTATIAGSKLALETPLPAVAFPSPFGQNAFPFMPYLLVSLRSTADDSLQSSSAEVVLCTLSAKSLLKKTTLPITGSVANDIPATNGYVNFTSPGVQTTIGDSVELTVTCITVGSGASTILTLPLLMTIVTVAVSRPPPKAVFFNTPEPVSVALSYRLNATSPVLPFNPALLPRATCSLALSPADLNNFYFLGGDSAANTAVVVGSTGEASFTLQVRRTDRPYGIVTPLVTCNIGGNIISESLGPVLVHTVTTAFESDYLPPYFLEPSSASRPLPISPPPRVYLVDSLGQRVKLDGVSCSTAVNSSSAALGVKLVEAASEAVYTAASPDATSIALTTLNVGAPWGSKAALVVTCRRREGDAAAELAMPLQVATAGIELEGGFLPPSEAASLDVIPLRVRLTSPPLAAFFNSTSTTPKSGTTPESASNQAAAAAETTASAQLAASNYPSRTADNFTVCSITISPKVFLQNEASVASMGIVSLPAFKFSGKALTNYSLTIGCSLGDIPFPGSKTFNIAVTGCKLGYEPVGDGTTCSACPARTFSEGGKQPCLRCPRGAMCEEGQVKLLPQTYWGGLVRQGAPGGTNASLPRRHFAPKEWLASVLAGNITIPGLLKRPANRPAAASRALAATSGNSSSSSSSSSAYALIDPELIDLASFPSRDVTLLTGLPEVTPVLELVDCFNDEACIVEPDIRAFGCTKGYTGPRCGVCEEGYAMMGQRCIKCLNPALDVAILAVAGTIIAAVLVYLALFMDFANLEAESPIPYRILINYLSALAALGLFVARGTTTVNLVVGYWNSIFVPGSGQGVQLSPVQCQLGTSWFTLFYVQLLLPFLVAAICILLNFLYLPILKARKQIASLSEGIRNLVASRKIVAIFSLLLFMSFPSLTRTAFEVFACSSETIDGRSYLQSSMTVECGTSSHRLASIIAGLVLVFFCLIVPASFVWWLRRHEDLIKAGPKAMAEGKDGAVVKAAAAKRRPSKVSRSSVVNIIPSSSSPTGSPAGGKTGEGDEGKKKDEGSEALSFYRAFGFLILGYRTTSPWAYSFESAILLRRALLIFISALSSDPFYQIGLAVILVGASLALHLYVRPFAKEIYNTLETATLLAVLATLCVNLLYLRAESISLITANGDKAVEKKGFAIFGGDWWLTDLACTVILLLLNGLVVAVLGMTFLKLKFQELRRDSSAAIAAVKGLVSSSKGPTKEDYARKSVFVGVNPARGTGADSKMTEEERKAQLQLKLERALSISVNSNNGGDSMSTTNPLSSHRSRTSLAPMAVGGAGAGAGTGLGGGRRSSSRQTLILAAGSSNRLMANGGGAAGDATTVNPLVAGGTSSPSSTDPSSSSSMPALLYRATAVSGKLGRRTVLASLPDMSVATLLNSSSSSSSSNGGGPGLGSSTSRVVTLASTRDVLSAVPTTASARAAGIVTLSSLPSPAQRGKRFTGVTEEQDDKDSDDEGNAKLPTVTSPLYTAAAAAASRSSISSSLAPQPVRTAALDADREATAQASFVPQRRARLSFAAMASPVPPATTAAAAEETRPASTLPAASSEASKDDKKDDKKDDDKSSDDDDFWNSSSSSSSSSSSAAQKRLALLKE